VQPGAVLTRPTRPILHSAQRAPVSTTPARRDAESDRAMPTPRSTPCRRRKPRPTAPDSSFRPRYSVPTARSLVRTAATPKPRRCRPQRAPASDSACAPMPPSRRRPLASPTTTHPGHLRLEGERSAVHATFLLLTSAKGSISIPHLALVFHRSPLLSTVRALCSAALRRSPASRAAALPSG
jgi:hypothetical protein